MYKRAQFEELFCETGDRCLFRSLVMTGTWYLSCQRKNNRKACEMKNIVICCWLFRDNLYFCGQNNYEKQMNYPLISEYIEAIKSAKDNFEELSYLRPVLCEDGLPVMSSGNFAVVFKMKDERVGKFYAVKCFTKEQEGRAEAYREIAKELKEVSSPYLVSIRYLEKELFVDTEQTDETEFPVLMMDWVEGKTLDKYLRENLEDKYTLEMLAYRFSQLAQWLIPQPFAHGDIKPDNILVREDGTLVLVDYDGMYVPAMKGQKARELGSPDFRHPLRTEDNFGNYIDDFPLALILFSLKAISINPLLIEEYGTGDSLLLSENDYRNIIDSKIMHILVFFTSVSDFSQIFSLFITTLSQFGPNSSIVQLFNNLLIQLSYKRMLFYSHYSKEDIYNGVEDENGILYSSDRKKLIRGRCIYNPFEILPGTETICDDAFSPPNFDDCLCWNYIKKITIPSSVKNIGRNPFLFCKAQITCNSPFFKVENNALLTSDGKHLVGYFGSNETSYEVPEGIVSIGDNAFLHQCLLSIKLPSSLESIGESAFEDCVYLENIVFPSGLKSIGNNAFRKCERIKDIILPSSLLYIGNYAFAECNCLQSLTIPSSIISIGCNPFLYISNSNFHVSCFSPLYEVDGKALYTIGKNYLISYYSKDTDFDIPKEVTHIGKCAFWGCRVKKLYLHDTIKYIGKDAFDGCFYQLIPELGYGYTMEILVSKGRYEWARELVTNRMDVKEI